MEGTMFTKSFRYLCTIIALTFSWPRLVDAQVSVKPEEVIGTWQLVSSKDLKTGLVTDVAKNDMEWMQFTKSHWTVISSDRNRKIVSMAEFNKLSPEAQVKTNYARIWNDKNEQIFAARGGTYSIDSDRLHLEAAIAIYTHVLGVDRVLRIIRIDKSTIVVRTEYPDNPTQSVELSFLRLD